MALVDDPPHLRPSSASPFAVRATPEAAEAASRAGVKLATENSAKHRNPTNEVRGQRPTTLRSCSHDGMKLPATSGLGTRARSDEPPGALPPQGSRTSSNAGAVSPPTPGGDAGARAGSGGTESSKTSSDINLRIDAPEDGGLDFDWFDSAQAPCAAARKTTFKRRSCT